VFILPDNPCLRQAPKVTLKTYTADDGRVFEETGEVRRAKKGEFIAGPMSAVFGPAIANRDTEDKYPILRLVTA
jgi:hypothetical protein